MDPKCDYPPCDRFATSVRVNIMGAVYNLCDVHEIMLDSAGLLREKES